MFLILVSWGWCINYMQLESFDLYIPLAVLIGIFHVLLMGLNKINDEDHDKFHMYQGWGGFILMLFRLGLFFYFMLGIYRTYKISRENIKFFLIKIAIFGTLYFLAYPIIVFINIFVNDYVKHKVISIGGIII